MQAVILIFELTLRPRLLFKKHCQSKHKHPPRDIDLMFRLKQFRFGRKASLFASFLLFLLPVQTGCERVNTEWHQYEKRAIDILGSDARQLSVVSDRWKISKRKMEKNAEEEYEWHWEIKVRAEGPEELQLRQLKSESPLGITNDVYYLKEVRYILHDKEGLDLTADLLQNRYIEPGALKTFSHSSRISKDKALRASQSSYLIITR